MLIRLKQIFGALAYKQEVAECVPRGHLLPDGIRMPLIDVRLTGVKIDIENRNCRGFPEETRFRNWIETVYIMGQPYFSSVGE